jgi:hypothetical protein
MEQLVLQSLDKLRHVQGKLGIRELRKHLNGKKSYS